MIHLIGGRKFTDTKPVHLNEIEQKQFLKDGLFVWN